MIGQFIQLDENRGNAGNIESQNRYAYALNNPNKYIDKNGRAARLMNYNYGGKPKGVYATKADYNRAHQKPSTSYKAPQTQDQRNPKAKTANTTRETYLPSPACSAIETLSKNLNDFKEEVLKGLKDGR